MIEREIIDRRAKLTAATDAGTALAVAQTHVLEAALTASLVPAVSTDNSARQLARSEIDAAHDDLTKLVALVGIGDSALDAEVATYGARRLRASAPDRELADANDLILRHRIVAKLSAGASTPEQQAAVRALAALPKFRGSHAAVKSAANIRSRT